MSLRRGGEIRAGMLAAYLEGEVTRSDSSAIEAALEGSAEARRHLQDLEGIRKALSGPIPELEDLDLAASVRRAIDAPPPPRSLGRWRLGWGVAAAIAACFGLVVLLGLRQEPAAEFRAKSAGGPEARPERWEGVQIYRVGETGRPERLGERLTSGDGLLFSYTNLGRQGFDYLMIFSVDSRGEVRWFYPAYDRDGTDPASIPIRKHDAEVPLAERIQQDFAPGPLIIRAVFTRHPLHVLEVEALLRERAEAPSLPLLDAVEQRVSVRVGR